MRVEGGGWRVYVVLFSVLELESVEVRETSSLDQLVIPGGRMERERGRKREFLSGRESCLEGERELLCSLSP